MQPAELTVAEFHTYPPLARAEATEHLTVLRRLPLSFLGILLSELITYDWRFPVERAQVDHQLHQLAQASPAELGEWMAPFAQLPLDPADGADAPSRSARGWLIRG